MMGNMPLACESIIVWFVWFASIKLAYLVELLSFLIPLFLLSKLLAFDSFRKPIFIFKHLKKCICLRKQIRKSFEFDGIVDYFLVAKQRLLQKHVSALKKRKI